MNVMRRLLKKLARKIRVWGYNRKWEHGKCDARKARRNRITGEVQFVMWKKGHQAPCGYVYSEDFWFPFHDSWWKEFRAYRRKKRGSKLKVGLPVKKMGAKF